MSKLRFSTGILQRLGEELNPGFDQSILELVKNSYDADARECIVKFENEDETGGNVSVSDDGDGMLPKQIENGWLVLGRSEKKTSIRTRRLNRIPAGSKGLGRLAALRSGTKAKISTIPRSKRTSQFEVLLDWEKFDNAALVDDVEIEIDELTSPKRRPHGTTVEIFNLKDKISRREVQKIARGLLLIADPFSDDSDAFRPRLLSDEYRDIEELVEKRYFTESDYHLKAHVDKHGNARAEVLDWKGKQLFSTSHLSKNPNYECPRVEFDFWVFILDGQSFSSKPVGLGEVRAWLDQFGGVHIYQNGIRVSPYGNRDYDWLNINERRSQSPEERPGTNTSIGRLRIDDTTGLLVQKTDRSGFIESHEFNEIKRFANDALEWLATERMVVAEQRRASQRANTPKRTSAAKKKLDTAISKASGDLRKELEVAKKETETAHEREVAQLQKEVQLYRTLSTAGITTATFAHESHGNPIKAISLATKSIETRGKRLIPEKWDSSMEKPLSQIRRALASLSFLGKTTLNLLDHGKRRRGKVEMLKVTDEILKTFAPFIEGRDVVIEREPWVKGNPYLQGTEAAFESIVTNLLNNSLTELEEADKGQRQIRIGTEISEGMLILRISDSGRGIQGIKSSHIWLPGRTTRKNGTGLGLTIVKDAVADLGGSIKVSRNSDLGGAEFAVSLPIISTS